MYVHVHICINNVYIYSHLGGPMGSFFLSAVSGNKNRSNSPVVRSVWSDNIQKDFNFN